MEATDKTVAEPTPSLRRKLIKCRDCSKEIGARLERCEPCYHKKICEPKGECSCFTDPYLAVMVKDEPDQGKDEKPVLAKKEGRKAKGCLMCGIVPKAKFICGCGRCYSCDPYFGRHNKKEFVDYLD